MTRQIRESVIFRGQRFRATELPLEGHPDCAQRLAEFRDRFTACRRGYVGTWHIERGTLHLEDLSAGHLPGRKSILAQCFPELCPGPTVVHWFTGWLHLARPLREGVYSPFRDMDDEIQIDLAIFAGTVVEKIERAVEWRRPKPAPETDDYSIPEFLRREHD